MDSILLVDATDGGSATVDVNYDKYECGVGESFTVESTTFTCTEIGNDSIVRLVGAVLAEQTDEWAEGRRCLGLDVLARCRLSVVTDTSTEEDTTSSLPALTA